MLRKIIQIDENKCNGCGACAAACHEGAIGMVAGKARLLRDDCCDGLGDCLPACPTGAISFIEREAAAYDEAVSYTHLQQILVYLCALRFSTKDDLAYLVAPITFALIDTNPKGILKEHGQSRSGLFHKHASSFMIKLQRRTDNQGGRLLTASAASGLPTRTVFLSSPFFRQLT